MKAFLIKSVRVGETTHLPESILELSESEFERLEASGHVRESNRIDVVTVAEAAAAEAAAAEAAAAEAATTEAATTEVKKRGRPAKVQADDDL